MRSSSLKVYSPVEYTGYKEKRSGHPSEPGSRTGNRKTTRKPTPILYRLRRFCKRLNWKGIGGLAVTTVVIVFAVRGVVGMFSEHAQTKTAPITTSSPAAEESQPYVFYYKDGQAVSWEDVTDAWAAEAGIQKRYALTDVERLEIAQVLTAEAGGEPFAGKIAVAQCILQTCEDEGIRPDEVLRVYAYSKRRPEPTQEALEAVQDGLTFQNYGCADQVYPYIKQDNETDFALFHRLCTLEGCQMLIFDGKLLAYNEQYIEGQTPAGSLSVDENGVFSYEDNRGGMYGSCEIASGSYSGKFIADSSNSSVLRPAVPIQVTSNAEAARFAKGLLRNANKFARSGYFSKSLMTGYAAASILTLSTPRATMWDGTVFVYKVRHDFVGNKSTIYFRHILEGY